MKSKEVLIRQKIQSKVYKKYTAIEDAKDLKREKLSLVDYHVIPDVFDSLSKHGYVYCLSEQVARFFERCGCKVEFESDGNYAGNMKVSFPLC